MGGTCYENTDVKYLALLGLVFVNSRLFIYFNIKCGSSEYIIYTIYISIIWKNARSQNYLNIISIIVLAFYELSFFLI